MTRTRKPTLLIADDHRMMADAIHVFIGGRFEVVAVLGDGHALLDSIRSHRPDIVLADISMPGLSGIEVLRRIRAEGMETDFVFMSVHAEPVVVREALAQGARGYLLKGESGEDLIQALDEVLAGRSWVSRPLWDQALGQVPVPRLTPQQSRILRMIAEGQRSREIAEALAISVRTVDTHRHSIMKLLGVSTSIALVNQALRLGLLQAPHGATSPPY
ncbi:response regulator [Pseudoxanthomonas koreensis]|uniref:response regulator n=1 Tax=Pseudoxanthomonas koreensis TaxID=266061 RepID=UPI0013919D15|nr:response regulator transcription factor [Pseudoxanthomonas koreensis]